MIDKVSDNVAYAVTSFGGFLGIGEDYYPLPWPTMKYDTRLGGYRTGLTADRLRGAQNTTAAATGTGTIERVTAKSMTTIRHRYGTDSVRERVIIPQSAGLAGG